MPWVALLCEGVLECSGVVGGCSVIDAVRVEMEKRLKIGWSCPLVVERYP